MLKYWRVKPLTHREKLAVELGCIQQSNWTRNWENINWISTSGIINVSVYLTAYSAYAIKSCSRFLMATTKFLRRVLFSFQSVSQPCLVGIFGYSTQCSGKLQPEVSCRVHAIVSKLCRFFFKLLVWNSTHSPFIVLRERERIKSSLSFHSTLGSFKLFWHLKFGIDVE